MRRIPRGHKRIVLFFLPLKLAPAPLSGKTSLFLLLLLEVASGLLLGAAQGPCPVFFFLPAFFSSSPEHI